MISHYVHNLIDSCQKYWHSISDERLPGLYLQSLVDEANYGNRLH